MSNKSPHKVNTIVYILIILFGIASWVDINGLWVELPILVQVLPEGWSLPSYMVVLIQVANLGPLIYTLTSVRCPRRLPEKLVVYSIIGVGVSACVLLVFFWDRTTLVGGEPHSTALFILNLFLALVDTMSSVVFLPFMAIFKPAYMTAYFIGEGFSGLLPGLMGLAQGAGRVICLNGTDYSNVTLNGTTSLSIQHSIRPTYADINFSIETFFLFIGAMLIVSGISFTFLTQHPRCKREYSTHLNMLSNHDKLNEEGFKSINFDMRQSNEDDFIKMLPCGDVVVPLAKVEIDLISSQKVDLKCSRQSPRMNRKNYIVALILTGWVNALTNSVLLSIQTYSSLPYGTRPFYLCVTLANVANPLASFLTFFICVTSLPVLCGLCILGCLLAAYILTAAAMSPEPVLVGTAAGAALIVIVWILCIFLLTFVKVSLAALFWAEGKKGLLYCGAVTQIGSAIGGVVMFVLVNFLQLFVMVYPC